MRAIMAVKRCWHLKPLLNSEFQTCKHVENHARADAASGEECFPLKQKKKVTGSDLRCRRRLALPLLVLLLLSATFRRAPQSSFTGSKHCCCCFLPGSQIDFFVCVCVSLSQTLSCAQVAQSLWLQKAQWRDFFIYLFFSRTGKVKGHGGWRLDTEQQDNS